MTQQEKTEKLFVVYWDDGYEGGPTVELHTIEEIKDFAGIEPLSIASITMLELDQWYIAYDGPVSRVKFWRVE